MLDPLHFLLVTATAVFLFQATRRTMAGPLTIIALICLVAAVVLLSLRNNSLRTSIEEERHLSLKSLEDKTGELDACQKDIVRKRAAIGDLENINQKIHDEKKELETEIERLKSEANDKTHLSVTIEKLNAELTTLREKSDKLQTDLDSTLQQVSALNNEKAQLQKKLDEAVQHLDNSSAQPAVAAPDAPAVPEAPIPQVAA